MKTNTSFSLPLPWQQQQWQHLTALHQQQHLPHALLLLGDQGLGIEEFAQFFVAYLFCQDNAKPCFACKNCHLIRQLTHPDFHIVSLQAEASAIKVDQIREAKEFLTHTSQQNHPKVLLIFEADRMNIAAMNALLKSLEEPAGHSFIILIAQESQRLLPTVRSRCQKIDFNAPSVNVAGQWVKKHFPHIGDAELYLILCHHAPLMLETWEQQGLLEKIKTYLTDINAFFNQQITTLALAQRWSESDPLFIINLLLNWLNVMIKKSWGVISDYISSSQVKINLTQAFKILDFLYEQKQLINSHINLNKQLLLENILLRIQEVLKK